LLPQAVYAQTFGLNIPRRYRTAGLQQPERYVQI
jgi:hypothetical protein